MAIPSSQAFVADSLDLTDSITEVADDRLTQTRIKIHIPRNLCEEPVISRLISQHGVTVNILAALLSANARDDGWFELELTATSQQIQSALTYLNELDLEIWDQSTSEEDGW